MPKVGRDGEIIRPKKPLPQDPAKEARPKEVLVKDIEKMVPVIPPEEEQTIPILYGFMIKCATISVPGIDIGFVCENCPFTGTKCNDAVLNITEEQEEEIAKILIGKKEEPCKKH